MTRIVQKISIVNDKNNLQINVQVKTHENYSPENLLLHAKSMLNEKPLSTSIKHLIATLGLSYAY